MFSLLLVSFAVSLAAVHAESPPKSTFVFPLLAPKVSSNYGMRIHPIKQFSSKHNGVDLAAPEYSHVRSVASGTVVYADSYAGYGNLVTVVHDHSRTSLYGHLEEVLVNPGEKIEAGHLIGRLGSTGRSTGPHLHFEWRVDGTPVDPLKVFPALAAPADG
jgi:murein DD-endopeptidase MepM/ murein hydrolase activator NlpD